jgi:hypothetical protein
MLQVTKEDIECNRRPGMTKVSIAVYGGAAYIKSDKRGMQGLKRFFGACEAVIDGEIVLHIY